LQGFFKGCDVLSELRDPGIQKVAKVVETLQRWIGTQAGGEGIELVEGCSPFVAELAQQDGFVCVRTIGRFIEKEFTVTDDEAEYIPKIVGQLPYRQIVQRDCLTHG
jgi:hypothetical protein